MYWRRKKAIINITIFGLILIGFLVYSKIHVVDTTKEKVKIRTVEFSDALNVYKLNTTMESKVIPLNENIITTCINGKKVIIVNKKIYYFGTIDSWGDIQGVNCEK